MPRSNFTAMTKYLPLLLLFGVFACQQPKEEMKTKITQDPHSFAKPNEAIVKHLSWDAVVDFENKQIQATATFDIETSEGAKELILDTKALSIESVTADGEPAEYSLGEYVEHLGKPLVIKISSETKKVAVTYTSSPEAEALQWLSPQQTDGKELPFLFTQSQAILARSWIPLQDSPGIRFTYDAKVKVPQGMLALMSAENPTEMNDEGVYTFKMEQPIPAYLMALSAGDLKFQSLGARSGVYAEPGVLESAAFEFEDTEAMIEAAEKLYGPYAWDRYDLLVLPPSFPFGGMENPRLTFATPTILAGDKSLVALVAHELAHSWSGNLVTNATWDDFWLNEGFTVYFENRIMESLYGREYSEMLAQLSLQDLRIEVDEMLAGEHPEDTKLKLDLKGRNPDDGVSSIAYDKGYEFLRLLEETVGREAFDVFLKEYFTKNAFKTMTTEAFVEYMKTNLLDKNGVEVSSEFYNEWIYGQGLPDNAPVPSSNKFAIVEDVLAKWKTGESIDQLIVKDNDWNTHQWLHFLRNLPETMTVEQMTTLDDYLGFTASGNSEITHDWLRHVVKNSYEPGYDKLESFLVNVGRRKFLTPLYQDMMDAGKTDMAMEIYTKARPNYHFVSVNSVDKIVGWE